ncbi:MAG: hypothetical protein H7A40_07410 [Chlamydiales bacterium]|nr:hypothetical protein [Chlamydiales bacterium]
MVTMAGKVVWGFGSFLASGLMLATMTNVAGVVAQSSDLDPETKGPFHERLFETVFARTVVM